MCEMGSYPFPMLSRRGITGALALSGLLFLTGCSSESVPTFGFDRGVTSVTDHSLPVWQLFWVLAIIVGIFTAGLIFWSIAFHRRKGNEMPKQTQYNVPTEVAYTLIPIIIVGVLFAFTAKAETAVTKVSPVSTAGVHDITVNGIQWSWQFTYAEACPQATVTGTPENRPILYMPLNEPVRFTITATDVDHSFYIPAFMIQRMNIPGASSQLEFTAKKLGEYPGRCAMHCGRNHSGMRFTVKVVTASEYQTYINSLKAAQA